MLTRSTRIRLPDIYEATTRIKKVCLVGENQDLVFEEDLAQSAYHYRFYMRRPRAHHQYPNQSLNINPQAS